MGSQQLLLIALGAIIAGIAIALGNDAFSSQSEERTKEYIVYECTNLATDALKYYRTSSAMGGGGNTFTNWSISPVLDTTINGTYSPVLADHALIIFGRPLRQSGYRWYISTRIEDGEIFSSVVNN